MSSVQSIVDHCRAGAANDRELAIALHDYVRDEIEFGFTPYFDAATPEQTLRLGCGHCNPQAALMVALFREAGFNARFQPATIDGDVLRGLVSAPQRLSHIFTEVELDGRWLRLDSYIADPALRRIAVDRLHRDGRALGYGCHATATGEWDGKSDAFSQVASESMIRALHEPVDDLEAFFASRDYVHRIGPISYNAMLRPMRFAAKLASRVMSAPVRKLRAH